MKSLPRPSRVEERLVSVVTTRDLRYLSLYPPNFARGSPPVTVRSFLSFFLFFLNLTRRVIGRRVRATRLVKRAGNKARERVARGVYFALAAEHMLPSWLPREEMENIFGRALTFRKRSFV